MVAQRRQHDKETRKLDISQNTTTKEKTQQHFKKNNISQNTTLENSRKGRGLLFFLIGQEPTSYGKLHPSYIHDYAVRLIPLCTCTWSLKRNFNFDFEIAKTGVLSQSHFTSTDRDENE